MCFERVFFKKSGGGMKFVPSLDLLAGKLSIYAARKFLGRDFCFGMAIAS
jgi:hypothetical protein